MSNGLWGGEPFNVLLQGPYFWRFASLHSSILIPLYLDKRDGFRGYSMCVCVSVYERKRKWERFLKSCPRKKRWEKPPSYIKNESRRKFTKTRFEWTCLANSIQVLKNQPWYSSEVLLLFDHFSLWNFSNFKEIAFKSFYLKRCHLK